MVDIPEWLPQESRVMNVFLRDGPLSATQAAKVLGIKVPACWNHIYRLEQEGILVQVSQKPSRPWGRQVRIYDIHGRNEVI